MSGDTNAQDDETERGWFIDKPWIRWFLGAVVIGGYLRLIRLTSRLVVDPPDVMERLSSKTPEIYASWHGQSNLAYLYTPIRPHYAILASNHPDGRMAAAMAKGFGYTIIDGSGSSERQRRGTGGLAAFRAMLRAVKDGHSLFLTADTPPIPGRKVSPGLMAAARRTGCPLVPLATASSRRKMLDNWDKMQINFPFSRIAYVLGEPLVLNDDAISDEEYAEEFARRLDGALERAFALADGKAEPAKAED
ncbi:lysophospholipid acyltransferase family protein [Cucumibacter marinus]|uniref:lysophospholipid acyltransferase family protein n=1 Tax=Cucumibacter marinus TaxID=1121252 RepID=UPI0004179558|nr:DUF374 domain-containing protein [Cucumibacter marinus]